MAKGDTLHVGLEEAAEILEARRGGNRGFGADTINGKDEQMNTKESSKAALMDFVENGARIVDRIVAMRYTDEQKGELDAHAKNLAEKLGDYLPVKWHFVVRELVEAERKRAIIFVANEDIEDHRAEVTADGEATAPETPPYNIEQGIPGRIE